MIEIKVNTEDKGNKQIINVESRAKHSGTFGGFVREMSAVLGALEKTDGEVFRAALKDFLVDAIVDCINEMDESEGEDDD